MNIKLIDIPSKILKGVYNKKLNIQTYGEDNLYPQKIMRVIRTSPTGMGCLENYERFIFGDGFQNSALSKIEANKQGCTIDDVLFSITKDRARYGGFAIHVNYNANFEVCEIQHVPFESCRLQEPDGLGYVSKIVTFFDWENESTRSGKLVKVSEKTTCSYDVFNPNKEVIKSQIAKAGDISKYKGQILWVSSEGVNKYPIAIYGDILTELITDANISSVKYRNTNNNFMPAGMMVFRKNSISDDELQDIEQVNYADIITEFAGSENACKMIVMQVDNLEDAPKFVEMNVKNYDKEFNVTEQSTTERIYAKFNQEPFYSILRVGKTGFSSSSIQDTYRYYNSITTKERSEITRAFQKVIDIWEKNDNFSCEIAPISFIKKEEVEDVN